MSEPVEIFEVGPRDGLQNEATQIALADKIALVDLLSQVGFARIEVASFVSPKWVPQMAESGKVLAGIARAPGVTYAALTPNMRGFEQALAAHADEIAVFASASEGFSQTNINCSIAESLERFRPVLIAAGINDIKVRGYVSCVTDCPFEGPVAPARVADVARSLFAMGCYEISLGDTIGKGNADTIAAMLAAVAAVIPAKNLAGHFHDTGGQALNNIEVALDHGLRVFDSAVGGLGGCPYAPGAPGNVATGAVNDRLVSLGFATGLDRAALKSASDRARAMFVQ